MNQQQPKIVIVGGGTAGWMAANLMIQRWAAKGVQVTLVESPDIGIVGVGEGSTPTLKRFFDLIGVDEATWMPQCNATYKVNIRFEGWSPKSGVAAYSHPFFSQVDTFTQRAFEVNCKTRRLGLATHTQPDDFFINGVLSQQNKAPITPPNFPFRMEYGYHFDSHLLGQFLAKLGQERGVNHVQAKVEEIVTTPSGDIDAITLDDGRRVAGDLFVDCTGFRSLLMRQTLKVPFRSFKNNLYNNAAVVLPTANVHEVTPVETRSVALSNGWCWHIPLTHRFGNGYVYSRDFLSADKAEQELRQHLGLVDSDSEARHLTMEVGQLEHHWHKNCLALGLSQGFIEPLEATALHLVQVSIELFMSQFEEGQFGSTKQQEFNQKMRHRFERVRDYIVAHYKLNQRDDSEYWCANRANEVLSDSLVHILDAWFQRQDLSQEIQRQQLDTHFNSASWHCLLAGYGAFPAVHPNQPGVGDQYTEKAIQPFLAGCALNFDSHDEALRRLTR